MIGLTRYRLVGIAAFVVTVLLVVTSFDALNKPIHQPNSDWTITSSTILLNPSHDRGAELFTYQGVLSLAEGQPATGTVSLAFEYHAVRASDEIMVSRTEFPSLELGESGQMMVHLPLPNAGAMQTYLSQYLRVIDLDSGEVIADSIPIFATPRAWHAQYANTAKFAESAEESEYSDYAEEASNATFALRAQNMLDNTTVDLTLQHPFRNWQGTEFGPARARKSNNTVFLSGYIQTNGPIQDGVLITTLPEGMRPEHLEVFWVYTDIANTSGRRDIRVYPNGEVIIYTSVFPGNISLSGIVFQAAP